MKVSQVLGAEVRRPSALGAGGRRVQDKLRGACERELHAQLSLVAEDDEVREDCRQTAPTPKDVVRLKAMGESAAWLLAIPYNPTVRLSNAEGSSPFACMSRCRCCSRAAPSAIAIATTMSVCGRRHIRGDVCAQVRVGECAGGVRNESTATATTT